MAGGMTFYQVCWYFAVYSFIGWCIEVIFQAVKRGKVINRGFLCGPYCPIYGFAALAIFTFTKTGLPAMTGISEAELRAEGNLIGVIIIFVSGVIISTVIELAGGWLLYTAFHMRWWDYSSEPMNFHGYICVRYSIIWGVAILIAVRIVHPIVETFTIPEKYGWPLLAVIYAILFADLAVTVASVIGLNKKLDEIDRLQKQLSVVSDKLSYALATRTMKAQTSADTARLQAALAKAEARDAVEEYLSERQKNNALKRRDIEIERQRKIDELKAEIISRNIFRPGRILRAFPEARHGVHDSILKNLSDGANKNGRNAG